jgi:methionine aminopeptidase
VDLVRIESEDSVHIELAVEIVGHIADVAVHIAVAVVHIAAVVVHIVAAVHIAVAVAVQAAFRIVYHQISSLFCSLCELVRAFVFAARNHKVSA